MKSSKSLRTFIHIPKTRRSYKKKVYVRLKYGNGAIQMQLYYRYILHTRYSWNLFYYLYFHRSGVRSGTFVLPGETGQDAVVEMLVAGKEAIQGGCRGNRRRWSVHQWRLLDHQLSIRIWLWWKLFWAIQRGRKDQGLSLFSF